MKFVITRKEQEWITIQKYICFMILFSGVMVNILLFPTVYIHSGQAIVAIFLGILSIGASVVWWKNMTRRIQKIALILGILLNVTPLILFLFFVISLG